MNKKLVEYSVFALCLIVPSLIVLEWLRYRWDSCGQHIAKQNLTWEINVKPRVDEYINQIDSSNEPVTPQRFYNSIFSDIRGLDLHLLSIQEQGKELRDTPSCIYPANRAYREWLNYPNTIEFKETKEDELFALFNSNITKITTTEPLVKKIYHYEQFD